MWLEVRLTKQANRRPAARAKPRTRDVRVKRLVRRHVVRKLRAAISRCHLRSRLCCTQHRTRIVVPTNGYDLSVYHVNVLGERNQTEDRVDVEDGDAVLVIDNKANDLDVLHDPRKRFQGLQE